MCTANVFLGLLAILFPPLPVWIKRGLCSADSLINIALCCLGLIPGLLHSWYIISVTPDDYYERVYADGGSYARLPDAEAGRSVTVFYVQSGAPGPQQPGGNIQGGAPPQNYGTVNQTHGGASSSDVPPPAYSETVPADNKVQK